MNAHKAGPLPTLQTQENGRRWPKCAGFLRLAHSVLDSTKGETIHILRCGCGAIVWDNGGVDWLGSSGRHECNILPPTSGGQPERTKRSVL